MKFDEFKFKTFYGCESDMSIFVRSLNRYERLFDITKRTIDLIAFKNQIYISR